MGFITIFHHHFGEYVISNHQTFANPIFGITPRHPVIFSDNDEGMFNHLRNASYLGSMKPHSLLVSQDPVGTGKLAHLLRFHG